MERSLAGFPQVVGEAKGTLASGGPHALLPFLFSIKASPEEELKVHLTDFHANTWQATLSIDQLLDKKERIGISGPFGSFLQWLAAAFSSDLVRLSLGGHPTAIGGKGATSATLIGQRSPREPLIRLELERVEGEEACDGMATVGMHLLQRVQQQSAALAQELARSSQLAASLAAEKVRAESLAMELQGLTGRGGGSRSKKTRPPSSAPALSQKISSQAPPESPSLSQWGNAPSASLLADTQPLAGTQTEQPAQISAAPSQSQAPPSDMAKKRPKPGSHVRRVRRKGRGTSIGDDGAN